MKIVLITFFFIGVITGIHRDMPDNRKSTLQPALFRNEVSSDKTLPLIKYYLTEEIDTSEYALGTHWIYIPQDNSSFKNVFYVETVRDTLIGNRLCNIIGVTAYDEYLPESEIPIFYKDDKVYFYEDGRFWLRHDFSKDLRPGDTVFYHLPSVSHLYDMTFTAESHITSFEPYAYIIESIDSVLTEEGDFLRRWHIRDIYEDFDHCAESGPTIVEKIGSDRSAFFGIYCIQLPSGFYGFFACFTDYNKIRYIKDEEGCRTASSIRPVPNQKSISMFPNPTSGIINIQVESDIREVSVYNFSGQRLLNVINRNYIDLATFPQSVYILQVVFADGSVHAEKILKE
ncbi:MAG TPA: T9SS type A sorting domain-containing protein [Saprospiraceae bacterium]|nr:T9SS type A sorting domain-containing protein [Saprospiraceae bacterium]